jgi:hypothetical protein
MTFGDITVSVIIDCHAQMQGLEDVIVSGVKRLTAAGAPGTCDVRVFRAGVDASPISAADFAAGQLRVASCPGAWADKFSDTYAGSRHVVIAAVYGNSGDELRRVKHIRVQAGVYRVVIGCGMLPNDFATFSGVPMACALLSTYERHRIAWGALADNIAATRAIPRDVDERIAMRLMFSAEQKLAAFPAADREEPRVSRLSNDWHNALMRRQYASALNTLRSEGRQHVISQ